MSIENKQFPVEDLKKINETDDLHIHHLGTMALLMVRQPGYGKWW